MIAMNQSQAKERPCMLACVRSLFYLTNNAAREREAFAGGV